MEINTSLSHSLKAMLSNLVGSLGQIKHQSNNMLRWTTALAEHQIQLQESSWKEADHKTTKTEQGLKDIIPYRIFPKQTKLNSEVST